MIKIAEVCLGLQAITATNYPGDGELFNFSRERVLSAGHAMVEARAYAMELPVGCLDYTDLPGTAAQLHDPMGIKVIATYLNGIGEKQGIHGWIDQTKSDIYSMKLNFPELIFGCLHPWGNEDSGPELIKNMVDAQLEAAKHAYGEHGIRLGIHTHYDTVIQPAENLKRCINDIVDADFKGLGLVIDTGHLHSVGKDLYGGFMEYAKAQGVLLPYVHFKARLPALDAKDPKYDASADRWNGRTYRGMVSPDTPGHETPFEEVLRVYRRLNDKVVLAMIELDNPRRHPREEIVDDVLYFKRAHNLDVWNPRIGL